MRPLILASLVLLSAAPARAQEAVQREVLAMGTRLAVSAKGPGATASGEKALAEAARIEAACSTWNADSAWSRLNATGEAELDAEWIRLLGAAKAWSEATDDTFDPALGRLIEAWGLRRGGRVPHRAELRAARVASGVALMQVSKGRILLQKGAWIEEGGFLKGYALDRMKDQFGPGTAGLVDFGGQLLAWDEAAPVSVADPKDRAKARLSFLLKDASLSCSGTSERGRHILDPKIGQPCEAWGSVAVVMPSAFDADCLSTALFVMGPERGLAWAEAHGVAAAFLLNDGALRLSTAFKALHPTEQR